MAYMSQERKRGLAGPIKVALKKYGIKATIGVRDHSTLVIRIKSGVLDLIRNYNSVNTKEWGGAFEFEPAVGYIDVNPYHYEKHFIGTALKFMKELFYAANHGNWDKSDIMTDYFNVGWYVDVEIGNWNKPYEVK